MAIRALKYQYTNDPAKAIKGLSIVLHTNHRMTEPQGLVLTIRDARTIAKVLTERCDQLEERQKRIANLKPKDEK